MMESSTKDERFRKSAEEFTRKERMSMEDGAISNHKEQK
jgi:hypothetical protein